MTTPLDAVSNAGLAARLKSDGFRKVARTWRRRVGADDAIQIVNLQGSMFASRAEGRCALNVAIYFPVLTDIIGLGAVTDRPTEADAHLRQRAAMLAPGGHDTWFTFAPADSPTIRDAGAAVTQLYVDFGEAWLDRFSALREACDELARAGNTWHAAAASLACNDLPAARHLLADALATASATTRPRLEHWGRRHALL